MRVRRPVLAGVVGVVVAAVVAAGLGMPLGWYGASAGDCGRLPELPGNPPEVGSAPEVEVPASAVREVATGLCVPWGVAFLPDGSALVGERRTGRLLSVASGGQVTQVQRLTGIRDMGEAGLLGIAVSPTYATDRWVYAYYTTAEDNRIIRFRIGEAPQAILTGIPATEFHAGGRIAFGPDGMPGTPAAAA